jgi:multidrug transporter EmrE-like cation transporter
MLKYLLAFYLASVDGVIMTLLKAKSINIISGRWIMPFTALLYSLQPSFFLYGLKLSSMTLINILWDVTSDIIVSLIGIYFFGEYLTGIQYVGLALCLVGMVLLH